MRKTPIANRSHTWPQRFWMQVNQTEVCWLWIGSLKSATGRNQYGMVRFGGKRISAHRASWLLHFGEIPTGLCVLHKCDNPRCVRPDHLFLGTNSDNQRDCVSKGRHRIGDRKGEKHPMALLTNSEAAIIRCIYTGKRGEVTRLAKQFDVPRKVVSRIVHHLTY